MLNNFHYYIKKFKKKIPLQKKKEIYKLFKHKTCNINFINQKFMTILNIIFRY